MAVAGAVVVSVCAACVMLMVVVVVVLVLVPALVHDVLAMQHLPGGSKASGMWSVVRDQWLHFSHMISSVHSGCNGGTMFLHSVIVV